MSLSRLFPVLALLTLAILVSAFAVPNVLAASPTRTVALHAAALPAVSAATGTPTPSATPLATQAVACLPESPPSFAFLPNLAYINTILPLSDGSFLLRGRISDSDGTWLARMAEDGRLLWQNVYGGRMGDLQLGGNGNIVLGFSNANLEIDLDGRVVRALGGPLVLSKQRR